MEPVISQRETHEWLVFEAALCAISVLVEHDPSYAAAINIAMSCFRYRSTLEPVSEVSWVLCESA